MMYFGRVKEYGYYVDCRCAESTIAEESAEIPPFIAWARMRTPRRHGGAFTVTKGLGDEFGANVRVPEKNGGYVTKGEDLENVRVINTPISEILISGVCVAPP